MSEEVEPPSREPNEDWMDDSWIDEDPEEVN